MSRLSELKKTRDEITKLMTECFKKLDDAIKAEEEVEAEQERKAAKAVGDYARAHDADRNITRKGTANAIALIREMPRRTL